MLIRLWYNDVLFLNIGIIMELITNNEELLPIDSEEYLSRNWRNIVHEGAIIANWADFERITMLKHSGHSTLTKNRNENILAKYYSWDKVARSNKLIITSVNDEPLTPEVRGKYAKHIEAILAELLLKQEEDAHGVVNVIVTYSELFIALGMCASGYAKDVTFKNGELSKNVQEFAEVCDMKSVNTYCTNLAFDRMRTAILSSRKQLLDNLKLVWDLTYSVVDETSPKRRLATRDEQVLLYDSITRLRIKGLISFSGNKDKFRKIAKYKNEILKEYNANLKEGMPRLVSYSNVHYISSTKLMLTQVKERQDSRVHLNITTTLAMLDSLDRQFVNTIKIELAEYLAMKQAGESPTGYPEERQELHHQVMVNKLTLEETRKKIEQCQFQ